MPTLVLQPDGTAGVDVYLDSTTVNFEPTIALIVGERSTAVRTFRTLIKFDLSSLPASAIISSATLSLYKLGRNTSNDRTLRVYRQKRDWVENQATWLIYKTANNWQTAGGFGANDCEQTDIGSRAFTTAEALNEFADISLTPTTKADLDLGFGWLLKMDTENADEYSFASSDNATAANRPKLTIVYTLPVGALMHYGQDTGGFLS